MEQKKRPLSLDKHDVVLVVPRIFSIFGYWQFDSLY
jgi:hypothetical protein